MAIENATRLSDGPVPARPRAPTRSPGIAAALLRPQLLANLIASFPDFWYETDFSDFRVGIASAGRGIFVNEPEAIRHILVTNAENYPKDDNQLAILKPLLGDGLLTSSGATWRRNRKLAAPIFQHSSVRDFAPLFVNAAQHSVERVLAEDKPFAIDREMTRLTLEIIGESILGADLSDDIEGIGDTVTHTLDKFPAMFLASTFLPPAFRDGFIERLVQPGRRALDIFARKIIRDAKNNDNESTLLKRMMNASAADGTEMNIDQVRDEVATFLLAGHETTATTLSWTWYLLTLYPDALTRIQAEVDEVAGGRALTADDVPRLAYTRAVIDETLRLYPVVANIMRKIEEDDVLPGGVTLRGGRTALISPWVMHRHRRHWRDADRFDPNRFLGEEARSIPRYAYLPFGGGQRICIGASFALLEAVLILGTFAQHADVRVLNAGAVMPQARIVLRPNMPLKAEATRRKG
ncbi:MAG: cytochrome P450 [Parvibaculum sp.]|uniref:cytochrome P450 n=1 Tax=Parvibaculum sp. TaxID=2024848 RepID=UPI0025FA7893|nr:cytochrome P450 [Parvibaculum sp.]MCE9650321.1 cytochrome P450 [Parvibaculum sp.]